MNRTAHARAAPIPVLLYHRIAADDHDRFAVHPTLFAEHLEVIGASGRTPMTIGELADGLRGERALPRRAVAITFDDGFDDTPAAIAAVGARGLRATLYVTTGALGRPGALSGRDVVTLATTGAGIVELGAHSVSHPHLDAIPRSAMASEVRGSRRTLEQISGTRITAFAYPHGSYDSRVRATVIDAGFRSAAAVKDAISHRRDDPWALARYTVTDRDDAPRLEALLDGRGAPAAWPGRRLRTRAASAARRVRGLGGSLRTPAQTPSLSH